jgi:methyltransferase
MVIGGALMITSTAAYLVLVVLVALIRLVELRTARRNLLWAKENGGVETGAGHYPWMVALHMAFLVGCVLEVLALDRPFVALLGWSMLALLVAAHGLRWWCITALGPQWNTRVVRVPGQAVVTGGPYRWLRHPNYVAVALEGIALPLVHSAWITALAFTVLNAALMRVRLRVENQALTSSPVHG